MKAEACRWILARQAALISLTLLLSSCVGQGLEETTIRHIPVDVCQSGRVCGDATDILGEAQKKVWEYLPDAIPVVFVYTSRCDALPTMQGKFKIMFVQPTGFLLWRRYLTASVSIDTYRGMMDIILLDYGDISLSTEGKVFGAEEITLDELGRIAHDYISASGLEDCDVTISRIDQAWNVRCGPLWNFVQECSFEVDPSTGEIGLVER